jgi:hypothetical protein
MAEVFCGGGAGAAVTEGQRCAWFCIEAGEPLVAPLYDFLFDGFGRLMVKWGTGRTERIR